MKMHENAFEINICHKFILGNLWAIFPIRMLGSGSDLQLVAMNAKVESCWTLAVGCRAVYHQCHFVPPDMQETGLNRKLKSTCYGLRNNSSCQNPDQ